MPIIAALIARGNVVLAEYSPPGTNFPSIARRLCAQIPSSPDSKNSYNYEGHNFNYLVESGITYICMTDQDMKLRVPYAFLFDINNRFKATYRERVGSAGSLAMNDTFSRVLRERIEFFSNDRNADKISKVKGEIEDAKTIMVKNIDKVLERGDKIEMLVSKTEDLNQQSYSFRKKSTQLKRKMCWQNAKLCITLICIVAALIIGGTLVVLWKFGIFNDILHHKSSNNHDSSTTAYITTQLYTTTQDLTTQDDITTQYLSTQDVTSDAVTSAEFTSSEITSSEITSSAITSSAITSSAITSSNTQ